MEYLFSKLKYFEDQELSLLGVNLTLMRYAGILKTEDLKNKIIAMSILVIMSTVTILAYTDFFLSWGNWTDMLNSLSVTYTFTVNLVKVVLFRWNHAKWAEIFENFRSVERSFNDRSNKKVCRVVSRNSTIMRKVTIGFMSLCNLSGVISLIVTIGKRYLSKSRDSKVILSIWLPFDQQTSSGFLVAMCFQFIYCCLCGIQSSAYDTTICSTMIWFSTQFDVLHLLCEEMGKPMSPDSEEDLAPESVALRRLGRCQRLHVSISGLCRKVNALQSPVMFVSLCGCSAMLGASIVILVYEQNCIYQVIFRIMYLGATLTEQFILYWFCNEVTLKSNVASMGVWESPWYRYGVRVRRSCLILAMGLQIQVIFTAGHFNEMTLNTFVSILKTTYTAYATLVNIN